MQIASPCLLISAVLWAGMGSESEPRAPQAETWTPLGAPPADLLGREVAPGADGAWCYLPELKGFLLYGGYSTRYSNEGWLYTPDKNELKLLWADDSLRYDENSGKWRPLMPREIVWSQDRPGPARGQAAVYVPDTKKVYLFGGHPHLPGKPARGGRGHLGDTRLGPWELDPATLKFRLLPEGGPQGVIRAVYDSVHKLIVVNPVQTEEKKPVVTWVYRPADGTWEARPSTAVFTPGHHVGFVFDAAAKKSVLLTNSGETWLYDAGRNEWTNARPAQGPSPRIHAAMGYDEKRRVTLLYGGVDSRRPWTFVDYPKAPQSTGIAHADTWAYDAARNAWTELKPPAAPPKAFVGRGCFGWDPDRSVLVLYDIVAGFWAWGAADPYGKSSGGMPALALSPEVRAAQKALGSRPVGLSAEAKAWQERIRGLADNAYASIPMTLTVRGSENLTYDSKNRCVVWVAGCMEGMFNNGEDGHFQNEVVILDMDVGQIVQRRASMAWSPPSFASLRPAGGCGRGFCYDSKRDVIWTSAGAANFLQCGTYGLLPYSVSSDTFVAPAVGGFRIGAGYAYDSKNDVVVAICGYNTVNTLIYDPKSGRMREGVPHPKKYENFMTNVGYDPAVGVILVSPAPRGWNPATPLPADGKAGPRVLGAFAYDADANQWRDLAPAGADQVGWQGGLATAYDTRNRVLLAIQNPDDSTQPFPGSRRAWVLDVAANAWKEVAAPPPIGNLVDHGLTYDANHNVFLLGTYSPVTLYRYRGGCPPDAFGPKEP